MTHDAWRLDLETRIETTRRALLAECLEQRIGTSPDGRMSEKSAAQLLGLSTSRLKALRYEGTGPKAYRIRFDGCLWSYRPEDLARWIELERV